MFSRISAVFVLASLSILAAATPGGSPPPTTTVTVTAVPSGTQPASQCNTGDVQCCNSVQQAGNSEASDLLGLLGIVLQGVDVLVGITCSPLSIIGISGNSCSQQPVCCQNNNFNGVVALGCTPINLNL